MIAYIPARGGSKRIQRKNIKLLGDKPCIGHVIDTLKQLEFIDDIYVSTDDKEIQQVALSFGAKTMELRSARLCADNIGFMQLIREDVPRFIKDNNKDILFALATACIVPVPVYQKAFNYYKKNKPQLLMATIRYQSSPFKALIRKRDGHWRYLFPEKSCLMTQELPQTQVDAGLFYFFNLGDIKKVRYFKSIDRLSVYNVSPDYAIDVDTYEDWNILERKYKKLQQEHI